MTEILEKSLKKYLSDTSNGSQVTARVSARRSLANEIGTQIFIGRIPQDRTNNLRRPFALTILSIGIIPFNDVVGEVDHAQEIIQFTVLGKHSAGLVKELCTTHVRLAVVNYRGAIGNDGEVYGSTIERRAMTIPQPPIDATDLWQFGYSMDIRFTFKQTGI